MKYTKHSEKYAKPPKKETISKKLLEFIMQRIWEEISDDVIGNYHLSMSDNYVDVDNVDFDRDKLEEVIWEAFNEYLHIKESKKDKLLKKSIKQLKKKK